MDSFFRPGSFPCAIYCRTRDKTDEHNTSGRAFIETLWRHYATFLDPDVVQRATLNMPAVFWELYVAQALHSSGINLQPQARTKQNKKGPDLFAINPDVWIEAVMPEMGDGPDAMQLEKLGVAYEVPVRGGSWNTYSLSVRASYRVRFGPTYRCSNIGFRCGGELS
jgi:hypothetical protein